MTQLFNSSASSHSTMAEKTEKRTFSGKALSTNSEAVYGSWA